MLRRRGRETGSTSTTRAEDAWRGTPRGAKEVEAYGWWSLIRVLGIASGVALVGISLASMLLGPLLRLLVKSLVLLTVVLVGLRHHADNGGLVWSGERFYARRWAFPDGRTASALKPVLKRLCVEAIGELLPHPALHHDSHEDDCLAESVVTLVFDRDRGGGAPGAKHPPVAMHLGFKASCMRIVIHNAMALVTRDYQGTEAMRGLHQHLAILNLLLTFLTLGTISLTFTEISSGPARWQADFCQSLFPNPRFCNSIECGGGPQPWQLDIARFMMENHGAEMGTSPAAGHEGLRLNEESFVLVVDAEGEMVFHVGRLNLFYSLWRLVLMTFPVARTVYTVVLLLWTALELMAFAVLGRIDLMQTCAAKTMDWLGVEVQISGESESDLHRTRSCGTLWVSNHYTLFDYTVMHLVSRRVLRTIVKADIAEEMPVLGPITSTFLFDYMGCVPYQRGSRESGARVREALKRALVEDGTPVLVFPEGTGTENGPPLEFRRGSLVSAHELGVPVQPVSIWYSEAIGLAPESPTLSQLSKMVMRPMQVVVKLGPLLSPATYRDADSFAQAVEDCVRTNFREIAGSRRGWGRPGS